MGVIEVRFSTLAVLILILAVFPTQLLAAPLIHTDDFNDTNYVDMNNTDAFVDTANGHVRLPSAGQDVIDVKR